MLLPFFSGVKKSEMLLALALDRHTTPDFITLLDFLAYLIVGHGEAGRGGQVRGRRHGRSRLGGLSDFENT